MSTAKVVAKNAGFLIVGDLIHKVASILFSAIVARQVGAESFGAFSIALVLAGFAAVIVDPGVSQILYRDIAEAKESAAALVGAGIILVIFLLPLSILFLIGLSTLLGYPLLVFRVIVIVGLGSLILQIRLIYISAFKASSRSELVAISMILQSILLFVGAAIAIKMHLELIQLAWMYMTICLLSVACVALVYHVSAGMHYKMPSLAYIFIVFKRGLPLGLQAIMILVYLYVDSVMLSVMFRSDVIGYYRAAYALVTSLNIIGLALTTSVFPFLVRLQINNKDKLDEAYYRTTKYLVVMGCGIATGTTILAARIIQLFYGSGFSASTPLLQILIWSELLIFLSFATSSVLLALDLRWALVAQATLAAVLNVVLNLFVIRTYGAVGAAGVTVATEVFALSFLSWQAHRSGIRLSQRWLPDFSRVVLACVVMGIVLWLGGGIPFFPLVILGSVTFGGVLIFLGFFDEIDIRLAKQALVLFRYRLKRVTY